MELHPAITALFFLSSFAIMTTYFVVMSEDINQIFSSLLITLPLSAIVCAATIYFTKKGADWPTMLHALLIIVTYLWAANHAENRKQSTASSAEQPTVPIQQPTQTPRPRQATRQAPPRNAAINKKTAKKAKKGRRPRPTKTRFQQIINDK